MTIVNGIFKEVSPQGGVLNSTVALYPNPTNDKLFIDMDIEGSYSLIIYNIAGQKVVEQALSEKRNVIKVNQLPEGLYYYEISSSNSNTVKGKITISK